MSLSSITHHSKVSLGLVIAFLAVCGGGFAWVVFVEQRLAMHDTEQKHIDRRLERIESKLDILLKDRR